MGPIEDAALCYIMLLQIEVFVVKIPYYLLKGLSDYLSGSKLLFSYLNQINDCLKINELWLTEGTGNVSEISKQCRCSIEITLEERKLSYVIIQL